METAVFDIEGKETKKVELPNIFETKMSSNLLHEVVKGYLANQRAGTHSTKTRGEVSGGGTKPWRQKGTGRARSGSIRSPLWRKGGIIFGPKPHSYYQNLSQKKRRLALGIAFAEKLKGNNLVVLNSISVAEPKTKKVFKILADLKLTGKKILLVVDKVDPKLKTAGRNIEDLVIEEYRNLNAYQVLWADKMVIVESALENIKEKVEIKEKV
ncbi:MAG: 50S ribosomal protein L4 [Elusimicrobia bacterium]|nr:50S ribosomal protein L4 [Candidatus Liberimonas magnetica]